MKFEEQIQKIEQTLSEDAVPPVAGAEQGAPANPAQVAPQAGQQPQQQAGGEVDANQLMQFALNSDPAKLQELGIDPNASGDDLFQAVHTAFQNGQQQQGGQQQQQAGQQPQQQTASAQPAAQSTSGVPGATQVGV